MIQKQKPIGSLSPRSQNNNPLSEKQHSTEPHNVTITPSSSPPPLSSSTQNLSKMDLLTIEKNPTWEKFLKKLKKKKNRTFEDIRHVDREMFTEMIKSLGFKDVWEVADLLRVFGALTGQGEPTSTS